MALIRMRINAGYSEPSLITQCWKSYSAAPFVIFITRWLPWLGLISIPVKPYHMRLCPGMILRQAIKWTKPGRVAQSVTCLATDACLTADPGLASSIPPRSHTFVEIDHEIISTVILLPSTESFKKGCCQLQAKVCARSTG